MKVDGCLSRRSLEDRDPPTAVFCPKPVFVEVAANATEGTATWEVPHVTADNCLEYGTLPPARDAGGLASLGSWHTRHTVHH